MLRLPRRGSAKPVARAGSAVRSAFSKTLPSRPQKPRSNPQEEPTLPGIRFHTIFPHLTGELSHLTQLGLFKLRKRYSKCCLPRRGTVKPDAVRLLKGFVFPLARPQAYKQPSKEEPRAQIQYHLPPLTAFTPAITPDLNATTRV